MKASSCAVAISAALKLSISSEIVGRSVGLAASIRLSSQLRKFSRAEHALCVECRSHPSILSRFAWKQESSDRFRRACSRVPHRWTKMISRSTQPSEKISADRPHDFLSAILRTFVSSCPRKYKWGSDNLLWSKITWRASLVIRGALRK